MSLEHVLRSRLESGCLRHSVQVDVENPDRLVFYEEWADMDSLTAHFAVPESAQFVAALTALAVAEPEIKIHEVTPA